MGDGRGLGETERAIKVTSSGLKTPQVELFSRGKSVAGGLP